MPELGFVVPAPAWSGCSVQSVWNCPAPRKGVGLMQRHLLAVFQVGGLSLQIIVIIGSAAGSRAMVCSAACSGNLAFASGFSQNRPLAVLHFVALFAQTVDKLSSRSSLSPTASAVLHNQPAFLRRPIARSVDNFSSSLRPASIRISGWPVGFRKWRGDERLRHNRFQGSFFLGPSILFHA